MYRLEDTKGKVPVGITIAGSDSGGGAGIQADLKTFAALGVHGTTAITSVTAQNTFSVIGVEDLTSEIIREQIKAVAEDLGIDAGKTGMLHTEGIIKTVSSQISKYRFPLVVDPVMIAKSGATLLKAEAMDALQNYLLPRATVITPNRFEAQKLAEMEIQDLEDAEVAAIKISEMGAEAVVIKGGHLRGKNSVDLLYYEGEVKTFSAPMLDVETTHGTGCSFSAAIAAELAKKRDIPKAVEKAKEVVTLGIKFGLEIGRSHGPVNPMAYIYRQSLRYNVLMNLEKAKTLLEATPEVGLLVPEVGMNIAMAVPYIESVEDVAAIDGRMVRTSEGARAAGNPCFGCSSHLARYIIEILKYDETKLAAVNLKFSEDILEILEEQGMTISCYDRKKEPEEIKKVEGKTVPWGVQQAVQSVQPVPDVIYHQGDIGKEPMIVIFGKEAYDLAELMAELAEEIGKR